jgi:type I restriction enzyme S subunit
MTGMPNPTEKTTIPNDWEFRRLSEIGEPVRGGSPRPAGDLRYFNGSFIPWLTVSAVTNIPAEQLVVNQTESCLTEAGSLLSRTLQPGTLIIANSGATLGVAKILGIECCANDGIAALLNVSENTSPRYLAHYINSRTAYLREVVARGNGQPNLNTTLIGDIRVPLPPTQAEQEAIAGALSDADALIGSLEQLIAKKRLIKQGAMQDLLSGQRRLPGFSDGWSQMRLAQLGRFMKASGVTKDEASSGPLPCVRYGEIYTRHDDYIRNFHSWISQDVARQATRIQFGDILFAGSGETKEEIGKCVAYVNESEAYAGGDIVILRTQNADPHFLGYYLNSPAIKRQKASKGQGDAVVHISAAALGDIQGVLPTLSEQSAIAAVIRDMDAEIEALGVKLAKTRQIKQGMMQELLTGRIRLL